MANQSLITTYAKQQVAIQVYYSLSAILPALNAPTIPLATMFAFLSKADPWTAGTPVPGQDLYSIKQMQKNMFVAKKMNSADLSIVLPRVDWTSGTTYTEWSDRIAMLTLDPTGGFVYNFYVRNSFDQIFKCLCNANGAPSTVEPFFQPGQYNTLNIFQGDDGYKWKFMYTLDIGSKIKFLDANWIPIPVGFNFPNSVDPVGITVFGSEGSGGIEVVNLSNGGSGYTSSNVINVIIIGDGTGAAATVTGLDQNGSILDIQVTNPGKNYTYANVAITSLSGTGATAYAPVSPAGGHGYDPISELGAHSLMISAEFDRNEYLDGVVYLPTDIEYYQMGIVVSTTSNQNYPYSANDTIYKTTTDLLVSQGQGQFLFDEIVYQSTDGTYATAVSSGWIGTVLNFDSGNNVINVINTTGDLTPGLQVFGQSSTTTRTLLTVTKPNFDVFSGYPLILQNLDGVTRSPDGIEQYKIVISA